MYLMMQQEEPDDFVVATGEQYSVRDFCTLAFHYAGIELEWTGQGVDEKGMERGTDKAIVEVSPEFFRPTDVVTLLGDPSKAKSVLGWNPRKTSFEELVRIMTEHDIREVAEGRI